ncbi:MAG TPA: hypothetical protein VG650_08440 [Mycobacteriales bacterium]|nr:hypothetical protein [Mycobacteriales bacterium]
MTALTTAIFVTALTAILLSQVGTLDAILRNQPSFWGWQLDLMAAVFLAIAVTLASLAIVKMARVRRHVPLHSPSRGLLLLLGLVFGAAALGPLASWGAERAMAWASDHTAAAAHAAAKDRAYELGLLGDANHPPRLNVLSEGKTPAAIAAPLLHASDLGADWYIQAAPHGGAAMRFPGAPAGEVSHAAVDLAWEKWNGQMWVLRTGVLEFVTRFASAKLATSYVAQDLRNARLSPAAVGSPHPRVVRSHFGPRAEWHVLQPGSEPRFRNCYTTVGPLAIRLFIDAAPSSYVRGPAPPFPALNLQRILDAATKRAEAALH